MNQIAIYGAGGFGKEAYATIKRINKLENKWDVIGFIDDGIEPGTIICGLPVLGNIAFLEMYKSNLAISIAVGNTCNLKRIVSNISNSHIWYPNIIDPSAIVDESINIGEGNLIQAYNFISNDVSIGNFNLFNTRVSIGHDSVIGSYNLFNPNVQISGGVKIGDENFWGMNSCIIQYKSVGNSNTIGACSLLIKNISDNLLYFGIPATKQQKF